jgi:UDP-2,3-diacylglucosamine pyrophosphatase LpxH
LAAAHQQNLDRIEHLSKKLKVVWVRGNHDNGYVPDKLGKIAFCRQYAFDHRILVTHGDIFDNVMPRSRTFMEAFRLMHDLRVRLGARPVHVAEYAKKWKAFYRVLRNNVMRNAVNFAVKNGYKAVTCGHTHFAEDTVVNGVRYINTGAWTEYPAHYLYVKPDSMALCRVDQSLLNPGEESPLSNHLKNTAPFNDVSRSFAETGQSFL